MKPTIFDTSKGIPHTRARILANGRRIRTTQSNLVPRKHPSIGVGIAPEAGPGRAQRRRCGTRRGRGSSARGGGLRGGGGGGSRSGSRCTRSSARRYGGRCGSSGKVIDVDVPASAARQAAVASARHVAV